MRRRALLVAIVLLAAPATVRAHHGWGGYDADRPLTLRGTVERVGFGNPHGVVVLRTPEKVWEVVLAPPFRMINRGLEEAAIAVGETVEVMGYPHRTRESELRAEWIRIGETTTPLR